MSLNTANAFLDRKKVILEVMWGQVDCKSDSEEQVLLSYSVD